MKTKILLILFFNLMAIRLFSLGESRRVDVAVKPIYIVFMPKEKALPFQKSSYRGVFIGGHEARFADMLLFNEEVEIVRKSSGEYFDLKMSYEQNLIYGGSGVANDLARPNLKNTELVLVVAEPVLQIGEHELVMGTKLSCGGEMSDEYGVYLPGNDSAFVNKASLRSLRELEKMSLDKKRRLLVDTAQKLIGQPYLWGGRSSLPGYGYDCAGFTKTVFATVGIDLHRPVPYQQRQGRKIGAQDLLPGDLIFTIGTDFNDSAVHVTIWLGDNQVVEASPESMTVRIASFEEIYKYPFSELCNGQKITVAGKQYHLEFRRVL